MKWAFFLILSSPIWAQRAPGELCSSDVSSSVVQLFQQEAKPSCFIESTSGQPSVAPITYSPLTKAIIKGQNPRNAEMKDFLDNSYVSFINNEDVEVGYFWPYDDVRRRSRNHYRFLQSGNESLLTDIRISNTGPFKRLTITNRTYSLVVICGDQEYVDKCVDPIAATRTDRIPLKPIPEINSSPGRPAASSNQ